MKKTDEREQQLAHELGAVVREQERAMDPKLVQYAAGSLGAEEVSALKQRAAQDPELAAALALHAPLSEDIYARLSTPRPTSLSARRGMIYGTGSILALAAAILLLVFVPREGVREKSGDSVQVSCWAPGASAAVRCGDGDQVSPGTALMFRLQLGGDRQVMMFGRDSTNIWKQYFPREGGDSVLVRQQQEDFLGASLKLDAAPGEEKFVIFISAEKFSENTLSSAWTDFSRLRSDIEAVELSFKKNVD